MTYNIHPLFVHFPIALLFVFSLIKILPVQKLFSKIAWADVARVFLIIGFIGALLANSTGEIAEHLTRPNRALVHMHENFASITIFVYGVLLFGEFLGMFLKQQSFFAVRPKLLLVLTKVSSLLSNPVLVVSFSLFGLVALVITGILGGVMVYGTSADPLAPLILNLLGISL